MDRLIGATLQAQFMLLDYMGGGLGTVIFHSRKGLGESKTGSLSGNEEIFAFWGRQGSARATSTLLVDLAGAPSGKEAGVDTSIVVHLFETMHSWEAAVLFSNDADLVPAVWSLRRRGKRVYCASPADPEEDASRPLIQASQDFLRWDLGFLAVDWALFEFLQPDGPFDKFLLRPEGEGIAKIGRGKPHDYAHSQIILSLEAHSVQAIEKAVHDLQQVVPLGFSVAHANHQVTITLPAKHADLVVNGVDRHAVSALTAAKWLQKWESTPTVQRP